MLVVCIGYRRVEVTAGDALCGVGQPVQWTQVPAYDDVEHDEQDDHAGHASEQQEPLHARVAAVDILRRTDRREHKRPVAQGLGEDEHLAVVVHQLPVAALLAGDEYSELTAVAAGNVELGVGQRLTQFGQAAVLLNQPVDGCAVHSHLPAFQARRHFLLTQRVVYPQRRGFQRLQCRVYRLVEDDVLRELRQQSDDHHADDCHETRHPERQLCGERCPYFLNNARHTLVFMLLLKVVGCQD